MGDSGIISQYGFLYQRKVFTWYVLSTLNVNSTYTFEGKDDIEINTDNRIYAIGDKINNTYIQVKSGNIDKNCLAKVFCNWLAIDDIENSEFILYSEKHIEIEKIFPNNVYDVIQYIEGCRDKKSTSIGKKVYDKYAIGKDRLCSESLIKKLNYFLKKRPIKVLSKNDLKEQMKRFFSEKYCSDIEINELIHQKRLNMFNGVLCERIDRAIEEKKMFSIKGDEIFKLICQITNKISEEKYDIDTVKMRPKFIQKARDVLENKDCREVKQLKIVNQNIGFIVNSLMYEIFYKDFRDVYVNHQNEKISKIEMNAYSNYCDIIYSDRNITPKDLYFKTLKEPINVNFLPEGCIYQKGCYIFLTGDDIAKEMQISWELKNDEKE